MTDDRVRGSVADVKPSGGRIASHEAADEELVRLRRVYALVTGAMRAIVRATSPEEMLQGVCDVLVSEGGLDMAWAGEVDVAADRFRCVALAGESGTLLDDVGPALDPSHPDRQRPVAVALREGRVVFVPDIAEVTDSAPWRDEALRLGLRSAWAAPLDRDGLPVAAIVAFSREPGFFGLAERDATSQLAADLTYGLERVALEQERARALESLRHSQDTFSAFMGNMPAGAFIKDGEGRYLFMNRELQGWMEGLDWLGHTDAELYGSATAARMTATDRAVRDTRAPVAFEQTIVTSDAPVAREVLTAKFPIEASEGEIHVGGIALDVTASHRLGLALAQASEMLRAIIDSSPVAVMASDRDGRVVLWNSAAERLFNRPAERVLGLEWSDVHHHSSPQADETMARIVNTGEPISDLRVSAVSASGTRTEMSISAAPIIGPDGKQAGIVALVQDVTSVQLAQEQLRGYQDGLEELVLERTAELERVNEELRRATDAKSQFLANMSHELRTPLNSIIGFTGIILQGLSGPLSEEQHRQLTMVYGSGKHLLALISDVLDLSRIEAGRTQVRPESFDVGGLAREVGDMVGPMAQDKGIELAVDLEPTPVVVCSDRTLLKQVLLNLLGNAVKFTQSGGVKLSVRRDGRACVALRVEDTGPGIANDELATIFDQFAQVRIGQRKPDGTGLGLAIAVRLMGLLGGDLEASSASGEGSAFTATLPLAWEGRLRDEDETAEPAESVDHVEKGSEL